MSEVIKPTGYSKNTKIKLETDGKNNVLRTLFLKNPEIDGKEINIGKALKLIKKEEYIRQLLKELKGEEDNLIVPSKKSLEEKYNSSIIATIKDNNGNKKIIGNISIDPFISSYINFKSIKVNTTGTLFVNKKYRGIGLGGILIERGTEYAKEISDIILSLTFNPKVFEKRKKLGFIEISPIEVNKKNIPILNEYLEHGMKLFVSTNNKTASTNDEFLKKIKFLVWINEKKLGNNNIKTILEVFLKTGNNN